MLTAEQFSRFLPVLDHADPGFPNLGTIQHQPLKGWLRGDSAVEAFLDCPAVPERTEWGRPMFPDSIVQTLGIPLVTTTLDLYKALVKVTNDAGIVPNSNKTAIYMGVRLKENQYHAWYVLSEHLWEAGNRAKFTAVTGIVPKRITDNVWLVHRIP